MSQGWETHVKWKSSREMSHKKPIIWIISRNVCTFCFQLFPSVSISTLYSWSEWDMPFDNVILHSCECDKELHVDALCLKPIDLPSNASFTTEAGTNLPSSSNSFNPTAFQWDSLQQTKHTHTHGNKDQVLYRISHKPCYLRVGVRMWILIMFDFQKYKKMIGILNITTSVAKFWAFK